MKKIILLGVVLLSLSKIALASTTSDVVLVDGAGVMIEPKRSSSIKLDQLAPDVSYDITCEKINANFPISAPEDIDVYYYAGIAKAVLDGESVQDNVMQLKTDHRASGYKLSFANVVARNVHAIEFTNLDNKAVVSINSCIAKVHH